MSLYDCLSIAGKQAIWAWGFLALPLASFLLVRLWPAAQAYWLSFNAWNLLGVERFIGLRNYARLRGDPVFWQATRNSFADVALDLPVSLRWPLPLRISSTACGMAMRCCGRCTSCRT